MNLTIKTLKGGKFVVEVEPTNKVGEVKAIVETAKPEFPAASMKLIHSGKVLKDDMVIESCNIKPADFLVCMVTKAKKPVAAPAPAASESTATPMETTTTSSTTETSTAATTTASTTATTAADSATSSESNTETSAAAPSTATTTSDEFPAEVVSNLVAMGFPEAEVRACLRASNGNPDIAVDFLMNGIPPTAPGLSAPAISSSSSDPLEALRNHPQFDSLRRLVQSNPSMLQAVLTQIGQQQPELLEAINANQAAFLQMMNEPVSDTPAAPPAAPPAPSRPTQRSNSNPLDAMQGMANPAQMAQMISSLSPTELNEMATMMGVSPDQLSDMAQMIGQIGNQGQFQDYMMQALQQEGGAGSGGGGPQVLRLTEEEMAAVDRLTEMGFDRTEAAQAFLACDKNEALAANLLMDSADGFGFGPPNPPSGGGNNDSSGGNGGNSGSANDDGDDMYD